MIYTTTYLESYPFKCRTEQSRGSGRSKFLVGTNYQIHKIMENLSGQIKIKDGGKDNLAKLGGEPSCALRGFCWYRISVFGPFRQPGKY